MRRPKRGERFAIRLSRAERVALERLAIERDLTLTQLVRVGIKHVIAPSRKSAAK
jgi:hypothetical protein